MQDYVNVAIPVSTIVGAALGYFVKYRLDKSKEINSENTKVKRDAYKKFVSLIINLFKNSGSQPAGATAVGASFKEELYEFYKDYVLYSSPAVINAFGDMMQYIFNQEHGVQQDPKGILQKLSRVMQEMRKELGLSNRGLGHSSERIFRAMFNDFDSLK